MQEEGQISVELLATIAVVMIVSIVVAALLLAGHDPIEIKYRESRVYWSMASPAAVMDAKQLPSGLALLVKNIGKDRIEISSLSIKDRVGGLANSTNFSPSIAIEPGQAAKVSMPAVYKSGGRYCELGLVFGYGVLGLEKKEIGKTDLVFQCSPSCAGMGEYCANQSECCTGVCPSATHLCACRPLGEACANSSECCNWNCGEASPGKFACCNVENQSCSHNSDCCLGMECGEGGKCFYPVPNLQADAQVANYTMRYGFAQNIPVRTWNSGTGPSVNVSTTRVEWDGVEVAAFGIPSLMPAEENIQNVSISCTTAGVKQLVVTADYGGTVGESDESDNTATYSIACSCPVCEYTSSVDYLNMNIGENVAHRAFDINISVANAYLTALWFDDVILRDYGAGYLNGQRVFYDVSPGPGDTGNCGNDPHYGPFYVDPALLNQNPYYVNALHFDIVDFCLGQVGFGLDVGYNVSVVPLENQSCACPPSPEGIVNISDIYFASTCGPPREFFNTSICPSGVCAWNEPPAPGACTICSTFPTVCSSNGQCCNGRCEDYNGTMRCAYGPMNRNGACDVEYSSPSPPGFVCVPDCSGPADCPLPLQCVSGSCLFPCSPNGNPNPDCGSYTTRCRNGYCTYP